MEELIPTADYPGAESPGQVVLDLTDPYDVLTEDLVPGAFYPFNNGRNLEQVDGHTTGGSKPVIQLGFEIPKWWQVSWPSRFNSCERCWSTVNRTGQDKHTHGHGFGEVQNHVDICETSFIQNPMTRRDAELEQQSCHVVGKNDMGGNKKPYKVGGYNSSDKDKDRHGNRKPGVRGTLSEFAERASIPGIKFMKTSQTTWGRAAWGVLLGVLLGLVSFHLYHLIAVFTSWQKATQVSLGFDTLQFPAVTFCNVNPARASRLTLASKHLQELSSQTDPQALITKMTKAVVSSQDGVQGRDSQAKLTKRGYDKRHENLNIVVRTKFRKTNKNVVTNHSPLHNTSVTNHSPLHHTSDDACDMTCNRTLSPHEVYPYSQGVSRDWLLGLTSSAHTRNKDVIGLHIWRRFVKVKRSSPLDVDMPVMIEDTDLESPKPGVTPLNGVTHRPATAQQLLKTPQGEAHDVRTTNPVEGRQSSDAIILNGGYVPLRGDVIGQIWGVATRILQSTVSPSANTTENFPGTQHNRMLLAPTSAKFIQGDTTSTPVVPPNSRIRSYGPRQTMNFINNLDIETDNIRRMVQSELNEKDHVIFAEPSVSSNIADQFVYLFSLEDRPTRIKLGHQVEDMLVDCSFNGGRCFPDNFTLHTSSVFGNCFTMDYESLIARRSGPKYGLTLVIFLEHGEFLKGLTSGSGGHVVIHGKSTHPFPEEDGLALPAGMEVKVALKLLRISRLGRPYGICNDGAEFTKRYRTVYTRRTCQHMCEQTLVMQHCGCHDSQDEETHRLYDKEFGHACYTEKELRCMLATLRQYVTKELDCRCENPCNEVIYTKSISMRQWPTDEFADVLVEALCESRSPEECAIYRRTDPRKFAQNFIKLNIYFEDLNYENITEIPSYEATQFFSDIGGALGLWMGLSVLAMTELAHLFGCLVVLLFKSMPERGWGRFKHSVRAVTNILSVL